MPVREEVVQPDVAQVDAERLQTLAREVQLVDEERTTVVTIDDGDSPYTWAAGTHTLLCDTTSGAIVVNLPPAAERPGWNLVFKKSNTANTLTLTPDGSDTIDGQSSYQFLAGKRQCFKLISDGVSGWWIVSVVP